MSTLYISTDYTEAAELLFPNYPDENFGEDFCIRRGYKLQAIPLEEARVLEKSCGFVPMSKLQTVNPLDRRGRSLISTLLEQDLYVCEEDRGSFVTHKRDYGAREKMLTAWLAKVYMEAILHTKNSNKIVSLKFLNQ